MKRNIIFAVLCGTVALYLGDDLSVRFRIPGSREPFGTVAVRRFDAISEKNNRTEYVYEDAVAVTCVRSLFPHLGYQPCWYLTRHAEQRNNY
jgi:hypothetical protein